VNCRQSSTPNIGQVKAAPVKGIKPRRGRTIRWHTSNLTKSWLPLFMILSALVSDRASTQQLAHALISPLPKVTNLVHIKNDFGQTFVLPQIDKVLESFQFNLNQQDLKITNNQHAFNKKKIHCHCSILPVLLKVGLMLLILVATMLVNMHCSSTWLTMLGCHLN